jgi:hypothetical protein
MPTVLNATGRGWTAATLPAVSVYVGRWTWPLRISSKWRNPFTVGRGGTREEVVAKYRAYLLSQPGLMAALPELRGKDLVCWCAPLPCHADVLLELANGPGPEVPRPMPESAEEY